MGDSKKFAPCYQGPFIIQYKRGEVNFHIKQADGTVMEQTVHQNRLKRYHMLTVKIPAKQVQQPVRAHYITNDDETKSDKEEVFIRKIIINNTLPIQKEHKKTSLTPVATTRTKQEQPIEKPTTSAKLFHNRHLLMIMLVILLQRRHKR